MAQNMDNNGNRSQGTNAFESLGLPALSSTAELRRVNERARVQRAMGGSGGSDRTAETVERLLNDPAYRMREAAGWYFSYATVVEADEADESAIGPHDRTLRLWHDAREGAASGAYDPDEFEEACAATAEVLNNPPSWQPLERLTREIGDARVDALDVSAVAENAAGRWLCDGLFAAAATGSAERARAAAEQVITEDFPEAVILAVTATVLATSAEELTHAAAVAEVTVKPLMEAIETDRSVANSLGTAAEELAAAAQPWWALIDVFDDDPDSGEEGRALDRVAGLLRGASVALFNHADDFLRSERLLEFASEIVQTFALKESLGEDLRRARHVSNITGTLVALKRGDVAGAEWGQAVVESTAATAEERAAAAELRTLVERVRNARRQQPQAAATGGSGCLLTVLGVVGAIVVGVLIAANSSNDESSNASGGASAPVSTRVTNPSPRSTTVSSSSGSSSSSKSAERLAIDRERSRLEAVQTDLDDLTAQIDRLRRDLNATQSQYPSGAPQYIVSQYEADRSRHNALVANYNEMLADYQADLDAFNRRVDQYNRR